MYGTYGYGDQYGGTSLAGVGIFLGILMILFVVAIIVTIVGTVMIYRKYVSNGEKPAFSFKDKSTWGPFFQFDNLIVDKLLKALYILSALGFGVFQIAILLASLSLGFGGFLLMLVLVVICTVIGELAIRLQFELTMLNVLIAKNTTDIKRAICHSDKPSLPGSAPAPAPQAPVPPVAPVAPAPAPAPEPQAPAPAAPSAPVAPVSVAPEASAAPAAPVAPAAPGKVICPNCGAENEADANFCLQCGTKLK